MEENNFNCDLRQNDLNKEGLHLMSQNVNQPSSKTSKQTGRSRTPDLKEMTALSHGIIEKSKTTGNLLVDQYDCDSEIVTKDRVKNYNTDTSLNLCRYNEDHKYYSDRKKENEKRTEENESLRIAQTVCDDKNDSNQCQYQKELRSSVLEPTEKLLTGKRRSQSQSPPSPKKLPTTNSETTMSPKNDLRIDSTNETSNSNKYSSSDNVRKNNLSQNPIIFELGPPNEPFSASFGDFIRKNEDELRENLSSFSNNSNYSGPASLDLTKDISINIHRTRDQSRLIKDNDNIQNHAGTDTSMKISKNGKHSSHSSSGSSGNLVNPGTGPSSLLSFESATSISNDSIGQSNSMSSGKQGKKKSWYNALYPTYKSRAEDFKKIFSALPQEEKLIVEYSCALQRDILVHGRLYVTKNYLCFYANIFRWETSVALRWKDVVAITKEKTALVIPNAIQICTENDERHFFTSFAARDRSYMMLFKLWQNALLDQPASSSEIWRWVHSVYGDELGLTSEDDSDYICPTRMTLSSLNDISPPLSLDCGPVPPRLFGLPSNEENDDKLNEDSTLETNVTYNIVTTESKTKKKEKIGDRSYKNNGSFSNSHDISDSNDDKSSSRETENNRRKKMHLQPSITKNENIADMDSEDDSLENVKISELSRSSPKIGYGKKQKKSNNHELNKRCKTNKVFSSDNQYEAENRIESIEEELTSWKTSQEGREIVSQVFPVSVDVLFALLFNNSKFYNDFQESRKTFDMVQNEWEMIKTDSIHYDKKREISFTLTLTHPMGPKHSRVTETQQMRRETETGRIYFVDVGAVNAGIPYADSFCVELSYCLSKYHDCTKPIKTQNWRSKSIFLPGSQLTVFASIKYKKAVWGLVKTFIEKNTWAGLEEFFQNLAQSLLIECEQKLHKEKLGSIKNPQLQREIHREERSDEDEAYIDREGNSDKVVQENNTSKKETEKRNTSMNMVSSKAVARNRQKNTPHHSKAKLQPQKNFVASVISSIFSLFSSFTLNEILIKVILTLLTGLLLSNSILFYKLWNLEERLTEQPVNKDIFELFNDGHINGLKSSKNHENSINDKTLPDDESSSHISSMKQNTDWLRLLHRQEVAHQLELEKWHAILGAATDLLRKTEESLTNLQRNIHPLAMKNLRSLLDYNDGEWSNLINDIKSKEIHKSDSTKIFNKDQTPESETSNEFAKSSSVE